MELQKFVICAKACPQTPASVCHMDGAMSALGPYVTCEYRYSRARLFDSDFVASSYGLHNLSWVTSYLHPNSTADNPCA